MMSYRWQSLRNGILIGFRWRQSLDEPFSQHVIYWVCITGISIKFAQGSYQHWSPAFRCTYEKHEKRTEHPFTVEMISMRTGRCYVMAQVLMWNKLYESVFLSSFNMDFFEARIYETLSHYPFQSDGHSWVAIYFFCMYSHSKCI